MSHEMHLVEAVRANMAFRVEIKGNSKLKPGETGLLKGMYGTLLVTWWPKPGMPRFHGGCFRIEDASRAIKMHNWLLDSGFRCSSKQGTSDTVYARRHGYDRDEYKYGAWNIECGECGKGSQGFPRPRVEGYLKGNPNEFHIYSKAEQRRMFFCAECFDRVDHIKVIGSVFTYTCDKDMPF